MTMARKAERHIIHNAKREKPATTTTTVVDFNLYVVRTTPRIPCDTKKFVHYTIIHKTGEETIKIKGRNEILQPRECFYDLYGENITYNTILASKDLNSSTRHIQIQFVLHREHITFLLQGPVG
jgi:hypothetical protein